ncbi:respirasome Complex Assembly Factor 1 [Folsomia candida]|uniref:Rab5-interacting protein n=1 Tax=Folsomia candida TaxID=158441 RepID=A0A226DPD9_FOLCA|nr:respirasome Complex Assembly Factor 1 [Folsomia candida]OXA47093.1 hypothetical protein Fcan01_18521 [Folsomia candida]
MGGTKADPATTSFSWSKVFTRQSEWSDKDEFLDIIYWIRQVLGVLLGLVWGLIPLTGILGLGLFFVTNAGLVYLYFSSYHRVDEEEFGGAWELTKEGFMTSFAGFLVTWIIVYSGMHFTEQDLQPFS